MTDDKYEFTDEFERELIWALMRDPALFGTIGHELDPALMHSPLSALLLSTAKGIAKEIGRGPSKASVVVQKLRQEMAEGKITHAQVKAAGLFLAEEREVEAAELKMLAVPVLKKRAQHALTLQTMQAYGAGQGVGQIIESAQRIQSMGISDESVGVIMGAGSFAEIQRIQCMDKLQTGILELDVLTGGGSPRGTLNFVVGDYGKGKSLWLCSLSAHAVYEGLFVGYLSLELAVATVLARIKAALLGVTINSIVDDPQGYLKAERMFGKLLPKLGALVVHEMPPFVTILDILAWKKKAEARVGRKMDVLCVDYMDKLRSHDPKDRDSDYKAMNTVYEHARHDAKNVGYWSWTASQAKNKPTGEKVQARKIGGGDASDSVNKARVADGVFGISPTEDRKSYLINIDKFRTYDCEGMSVVVEHDRGKSRMAKGMLPDATEE